MDAGAFIPFPGADDLDEQLARLVAERSAFVERASARRQRPGDTTGVRSPKRTTRARAAQTVAGELERYNALLVKIDRLSALKDKRTERFVANWMRSRPQPAQEVMRRLPPVATVKTTQPVADLAPGTPCTVVYYSDDGSAVGVIRIMRADGAEEHEAFDLPRHTRLTDADQLLPVPALTRLSSERVGELLAS